MITDHHDFTEEELAELEENLQNYRWRFSNLYWIEPAERGISECLFEPRDEQWEILEDIYENGNTRLAILKARQLGFSTLLALICLDHILFNAGFVCGIVDQTKDDAQKKMAKITFAWSKLPDDLKAEYVIQAESKSELSISRPGEAPSTIYAGKNARGGTHQLLWISEWGAIQYDDPDRSDDIADGALPSAEMGIIVVETTWKGGKTGRLYTEVVEPSLKLPEKYRTTDDWLHKFFPWWLDEKYWRDGDARQIGKECMEYLREIEDKEEIDIPIGQKLWYWKVAWKKNQKRYEEFPSTLEEIFLSPVEGAIYGKWMDKAMVEGRIIPFPLAKQPVWVSWDIGKADLMCLTFIQVVGMQPRIYDAHFERGATMAEMARYVQRWEKTNKAYIAGHYLPHDGGAERLGKDYNQPLSEMLEDCGLENIQVVPVIPQIGMGIDMVRERLPGMIFHADNLARVYEFGTHRLTMLDALNTYRFGPVDKKTMKPMPMHDIYSHPCDSLRTYCEADERGMVPRVGAIPAGQAAEDDDVVDLGFEMWDD